MVQYDMPADCDGEVTLGALPCLVPELPRVVKRVVPGPSMTRQRIVKTHDLVETRPTSSWRPFSCCLPIKANRVICSNVGPTFPNHEGVISNCGIVVGSGFHRRSPLPRTKRGDTRLMLALEEKMWEEGTGVDTRRERERKTSRRWQPCAVSSQARPTL